MTKYILRGTELFAMPDGTMLVASAAHIDSMAEHYKHHYFLVHEGDVIFYQLPERETAFGKARILPKGRGHTWVSPSKDEIEIAKAHLLILEP